MWRRADRCWFTSICSPERLDAACHQLITLFGCVVALSHIHSVTNWFRFLLRGCKLLELDVACCVWSGEWGGFDGFIVVVVMIDQVGLLRPAGFAEICRTTFSIFELANIYFIIKI